MKYWMTDDRPTLLIDAEFNEVHVLTKWQAYAYNVYAQGLKNKMWVKETSRPYWHMVNPDPIVLPFGLWEQAEERHCESTPVKKTLSQEEKAALKAVLWGRYWDHRKIRKNWFALTYGRGADV